MAVDTHDIELTEDQKRRLTNLSNMTGWPWSILLEDAIERALPLATLRAKVEQQNGSVYDDFVQAGLIGGMPEAPPDLSTNPDHMRGFGGSW